MEVLKLTKYEPADGIGLPRFTGVRTFMRLPHVQDLENSDVAIVGVPFDTGATFRSGARFGPESIRNISHCIRGYHPSHKINIFDYLSVIDYGDLPIVPGYIDASYEKITSGLKEMYKKDVIPIVLGGDHSITLAELRAIGEPVALLQFDSHSDTRDSYYGENHNHATPFYHAVKEGLILPEHSVQVGLRGPVHDISDWEAAESLGLEIISTDKIREIGIAKTIERIREKVGHQKVFLSFDIDFVDPAFAPGTGTPMIGGFTSYETQTFIRGLKGLNIIGSDVVEVYPEYDSGQITSLLAANIIYELLSIMADFRRNRS